MADKLKLTAGQAIELLQAVGVPVADIDDAAEAADVDSLISQVDEARTKIIRPQIEGEIDAKWKAHYAGVTAGTTISAIAREYGINKLEMAGMKEAEAVKYALSKHNEKFSKDTEELRKEMSEMVAAHNKALEDTTSTYEAKLQAANEMFDERDMDEYLLGHVNKLTRTTGDDAFRVKEFKRHIREEANVKWDKENKKILLRQKDNPEVALYNDKKTKEVQIEDLLPSYGERAGWITKDMRDVNPADAMARRAGQQPASGLPPKPSNETKNAVQQRNDDMLNWAEQPSQQ